MLIQLSSLPDPMDAREEVLLLWALNTDQCDNARTLLIRHYLRLAVCIAGRFHGKGQAEEDLISIGTIGLIKAAQGFDPKKGGRFSSYAARCIENEIRMYLRKNRGHTQELSLDGAMGAGDPNHREPQLPDVLGTDEDIVYQHVENHLEHQRLVRALWTLPRRERTVIDLRFGLSHPLGQTLTQKDTARRMGVSQSYLSRWEKRILRQLRQLLSEE